MPAAYDKETAFAELVRDYENLWVAIIDKDGEEFVVGTGKTAVEADKEALSKGYSQAMLCKVPSFNSRFIS
jgi:hypothetical protein